VPIVEAANLPTSGWACRCKAFKLDEPTPEQAVKALARSVAVTVEDQGERYGYRCFMAWTDLASRYHLVAGPGVGGFCKHIIACSFIDNPWLQQAAIGTDDLLIQVVELQKENRKLRRENERWQKKCTD